MEKQNKVAVNLQQDFTEEEKATARTNIGAVSADEVAGRTVYINWDGSTDKFADIAAIVAAGNVPVVRYNNYDYVCTDSQNDGRFVFMSSLGEGGVFSYIQFFRGGTQPQVSNVNLALPYHTSSDIGKVLGLVQGSGSEILSWVAQPGSELPAYTSNEAGESLVVNANGDGVEWDRRVRGILTEDDGQGSVTSSDIRNLRINTNVGNAGLVRVTPVGGSVQIIGYLAPDYAMVGDEGKLLRINSSGTDLEWANPPFVKHDTMRTSSWAWMNPHTEEYPIFGGEMTFKMEWAANDHGLGPSAMTPYLKGKVVTASNWTAYIHVSKGASGNMTYQETSIIHGTANNTYVDLSQCDYGNGFKVAADTYPMIVNMDIQYVKGANNYAVGHLTWTKTDDWVFLRTTYDG